MTRLERYEQRTAGAMTTLSLVFLATYAVPVLRPGLDGWLRVGVDGVNLAVWAVFALDLGWRLRLAEHRLRFLLGHPVDVLAVVLPVLRPLRVLRVFAVSQTIFTRRAGLLASGQAVLVGAVLLVVVSALAMLDVERDAPGAVITSFDDALWWGITTVTTVGYGDLVPVTGTGRTVAAALMLVGISMVGIISASVAAWFVGQASGVREARHHDRIDDLQDELTALRAQLTSIQRAVGADVAPAEGPAGT